MTIQQAEKETYKLHDIYRGHIEKAIQKAGSMYALGKETGISQSTIRMVLSNNDIKPMRDMALKIG